MLSSAKEKKKPHGDAESSARHYTGPKQIRWFFDDGSTVVCTEDHKFMAIDTVCYDYSFDGPATYVGTELRIGDAESNMTFLSVDPSFDFCIPVKYYHKEDAGELNAYDIEIDHPTSMYLLANGMPTHNSKHAGGIGGKKVINP